MVASLLADPKVRGCAAVQQNVQSQLDAKQRGIEELQELVTHSTESNASATFQDLSDVVVEQYNGRMIPLLANAPTLSIQHAVDDRRRVATIAPSTASSTGSTLARKASSTLAACRATPSNW